MKTVLIDTDVILDFLFDRQPFSQDSAEVLRLCENGAISGYVTAVALSNIYHLLRKTAKHEKVVESLRLLLSFLDVAVTDKAAFTEALNSGFKDFEDALQNFSAAAVSEITVIITRNIKDYKTSRLAVMSPDVYLESLEDAMKP